MRAKAKTLLILIVPMIVASSLLAYWVYIWTSTGVALPPMKPLKLTLQVSNETHTSVNGQFPIETSRYISVSLSAKYPYPWELMRTGLYYYYMYPYAYYSPVYGYYYRGYWYPSYQAYYYGYYYAFHVPRSISFRWILAMQGLEGDLEGRLALMHSGEVSLNLGESRSLFTGSIDIRYTGKYLVSAYAWTDYIHRAGNLWASLAEPISNIVIRR